MDDAERKRQLLIELARARSAMARAGGGVRHGLDLGARMKESVQNNPAWWIGGAAAGVGVILLVARVRRPVVQVPRVSQRSSAEEVAVAAAKPAAAAGALGLALTIGRWVWPLLKPLVLPWVTQKAAELFGKKGAPPPGR